ncbi:Attachment to host cells and virulence [Staphylococcus aureus]|nr:Attachment to host cells and virulence [Staphylococcus aureus]
MSPKTREAAEKGLPNALFTVTLYDKDRLIGMGRVIGDGGTVFQIVDIAVSKSYQGQDYGSLIMEHIMKYIKNVSVESAYVSLIADYPLDLCLPNQIQAVCISNTKLKKTSRITGCLFHEYYLSTPKSITMRPLFS